ncbi:MAG TPA: hypothetical protein PLI78_09450 [Dokdonella sp.]|nr:hypothetical protein [Dokdonella sp.]
MLRSSLTSGDRYADPIRPARDAARIRGTSERDLQPQAGRFRERMQGTAWIRIRNTRKSEEWFGEHARDIRETKGDCMRKRDRADPVRKNELTLNARRGLKPIRLIA